jgi:hypothetical protein
MDTTLSAIELLKRLSSAEIRDRLAKLEAEQAALKTLLRAAVRNEKAQRDSDVQS